jgi:Calcineurin-like phosphoesterase
MKKARSPATTMRNGDISRNEFEGALKSAAYASIASAGDETPVVPFVPTENLPEVEDKATDLLLEAIERLDRNPSLLSGDPDEFFTYEDPILAVALMSCQINADEIASAGQPGEDLRNGSVFAWARVGVHAFLSRYDSSLLELAGRTPTRVALIRKEKPRIAILGDAGYRGQSQDNVISSILQSHNKSPYDFAIHLGDTYYGGDESEMLKNLLEPLSALTNAGIKVFTLVGNHDLYYGADGYLAALRILDQPGRYFLIETPAWRIACLDTSLAAMGIFRADAKLDEGQLDWLDSLLNAKDKRPLILMSHHYIVSGWGDAPPSLIHQLQTRVKDRVFAWYWGHEHGCAIYDRDPHGFYGACVGNGAFVEIWSEPKLSSPRWYARGRCECYPKKKKNKHYWPHGFLDLTLDPNELIETYRLERNEEKLRTLTT